MSAVRTCKLIELLGPGLAFRGMSAQGGSPGPKDNPKNIGRGFRFVV